MTGINVMKTILKIHYRHNMMAISSVWLGSSWFFHCCSAGTFWCILLGRNIGYLQITDMMSLEMMHPPSPAGRSCTGVPTPQTIQVYYLTWCHHCSVWLNLPNLPKIYYGLYKLKRVTGTYRGIARGKIIRKNIWFLWHYLLIKLENH